MANEPMGRDRELILPPNTYASVLDSTKGKVSVFVGPHKSSLSNTDQLVTWDPAQRRFIPSFEVERSVQVFPMADEGQYIVLHNPVADGKVSHPSQAVQSDAVALAVGRKINIPGPVTFPLWPGQVARTIDGHHLRHNQYLVVRVYDEEQARQNWRSAVVKPVKSSASQPGQSSEAEADASTPSPAADVAPELTIGQLMVVRGTEVSFYIPPTGIEVVPEADGKYVREAVTLERLEYCILLDENGEKRPTRGPDVVFPRPTESFVEGEGGFRKFRAIELNPHSGLHIKVIAEYEEEGKTHRVGEEIFITGREQAIYFPRPEHSIIEYGSRKVHYAVAIPAGEGRYVLDRDLGTVDLVKGPSMFLPDPLRQVVVLRILDPHTVDLLYPGNSEAREVNLRYKALSADLSPGEYLESREAGRSVAALAAAPTIVRGASEEFVGDAFQRRTSFTPPRTIVLDTKYEGAVSVNIWPGYAVLVTNKTGERRVEVGPKVVLLEYDETLMPLTLSTGRPKSDTNPLRTAYLRVMNNQVSDRVVVETKDLVSVTVDISYRVNFEGEGPEEQIRWFGVEDYVKILTDHGRSRMRNAAKRFGIREFYTTTIDILRDALLGPSVDGKRSGLPFTENGMRVYDVEILGVSIENQKVSSLLTDAQTSALSGAIEISRAEEEAMRTARLEDLKRQGIEEKEKTAVVEAGVEAAKLARNLEHQVSSAQADLSIANERKSVTEAKLAVALLEAKQEIDLAHQRSEQQLRHMGGESKEFTARMAAINEKLVDALRQFGDRLFVEKVTTALGPAAMASGVSNVDLFRRLFKGTPFEPMFETLAIRPLAAVGSDSREYSRT